jgi:flagellar biosynthetic protein FlhB
MSDTYGAETRTEQATPRRLQRAREEGQIVRAHAVAGAAVLLAGAGLLVLAGPQLLGMLELAMRAGLSLAPEHMRESALLADAAGAVARPAVLLLAPLLLVLAAVAFVADLAIGGWVFSTHPLTPDLNRINPLSGLRRLFSGTALAEIVKAVVKLAVVGAVAFWLIRARLDAYLHVAAETWPHAAQHSAALGLDLFLVLAAALAAVTALEVPYQIWSFRNRLKMTRQELRDELREQEGSPQTRRRIRNLRTRMARGRMMAEVAKADVVVVNPEHYAAALTYREGGMRAPRLVGKGTGLVALRIREIAAEHQVPVLEAPPLARAIVRYVELGDEIPIGLYGAVAEVLAYVYRLRAAREAGAPLPPVPGDDRFAPPPEYRA